LAERLHSRYDAIEVELIKGREGSFEVRRDGELIFSKKQTGRFPDEEEIFAALDR
jgi:selT/selW/selH-like putative selenoprotein